MNGAERDRADDADGERPRRSDDGRDGRGAPRRENSARRDERGRRDERAGGTRGRERYRQSGDGRSEGRREGSKQDGRGGDAAMRRGAQPRGERRDERFPRRGGGESWQDRGGRPADGGRGRSDRPRDRQTGPRADRAHRDVGDADSRRRDGGRDRQYGDGQRRDGQRRDEARGAGGRRVDDGRSSGYRRDDRRREESDDPRRGDDQKRGRSGGRGDQRREPRRWEGSRDGRPRDGRSSDDRSRTGNRGRSGEYGRGRDHRGSEYRRDGEHRGSDYRGGDHRGQGSRSGGQHDQRGGREQRRELAGSRVRAEDADQTWPELPDWVDRNDLGKDVLADLRGLSKQGAEFVAGHLVAAGALAEEDPDSAWEHARAARSQGGRIAVVRETVGLVAYRAGRWAEAIAELRAARRMSGGPGLLAVMADAERALGHPERAVDLARSKEAALLDPAAAAELAIVAAGARAELGQGDAALVMLRSAAQDVDPRVDHAFRLYYAYAALLAEMGRRDEAVEWFVKALEADADEESDAAERITALSAGPQTGGGA